MPKIRDWWSRFDRTVHPSSSAARQIEVLVDGRFRPGWVGVQAGERVRLRFLRRDDSACTRKVIFPTLGIEKELPTGREVLVDLPELPVGEHPFTCGMDMVRGSVVVTENPFT